MAPKFILNRQGVAAILRGPEVTDMVAGVTAEIARHAQASTDLEIVTRHGVTDRRVGQVIIADTKGVATQAKHGTLTKAAAAAGVEVQGR